MTKTITCGKCWETKTAIQLAYEGVLFYRSDEYGIICEFCKEDIEDAD